MDFYPATIVAVDEKAATARFDTTGHEIRFWHNAHNALPLEARQTGVKGFVSFPKAPAMFTLEIAARSAA